MADCYSDKDLLEEAVWVLAHDTCQHIGQYCAKCAELGQAFYEAHTCAHSPDRAALSNGKQPVYHVKYCVNKAAC